MNTTANRLNIVCDLCRAIHEATEQWPMTLAWVGSHHRDAWLATVGPHQPSGVCIRNSVDGVDHHITVWVVWSELNSVYPLPGLYATFEGVHERMRLDSNEKAEGITPLVRQLLQAPGDTERAQCLLCDIPLPRGRVGDHLREFHDIEAICYVGKFDGVREYNDPNGRAVLWRWEDGNG